MSELKQAEPSQHVHAAWLKPDMLMNRDDCQTSGGPRLRSDLRKQVSEGFG